jgi:hypothetical protein
MSITIRSKEPEPPGPSVESTVFGTAIFEDLVSRLRTGTSEQAAEAAVALREQGARAVTPLMEALSSPYPEVREAAAETLGEVGDERAIQPLTDALVAEHGGKSPRFYLMIGIFAVIGIAVLIGSLVYGLVVLKIGGAMSGVWFPLSQKIRKRRLRARELGCTRTAIIRALTRIAERHATPELMRLVPDLHAIAADSLRQQAETRAVSREAAARITTLTERLRALPVAVEHAPTGPDVLPRPATSPEPDATVLPRTGPPAD